MATFLSASERKSYAESGLYPSGLDPNYPTNWNCGKIDAPGGATGLWFDKTYNAVTKVHWGIDIVAERGRKIVSSTNGHVRLVEHSEAGSEYILIHSTPEDTRMPWHLMVDYRHLKPGSVKVVPGQKVVQGQELALMGSSGTDFVHLHQHVFHNGSGAYHADVVFDDAKPKEYVISGAQMVDPLWMIDYWKNHNAPRDRNQSTERVVDVVPFQEAAASNSFTWAVQCTK